MYNFNMDKLYTDNNRDHKVYISQKVLQEYASMKQNWAKILGFKYSSLHPGDVICDGYYRMTLDDMREALIRSEIEEQPALQFFMTWFDPMIKFLYSDLCLDELLGDDPDKIQEFRMLKMPETDEDLLTWILVKLFNDDVNLNPGNMYIPAKDYIDSSELIQMIDWHMDECDYPVDERHYIDAIKGDFLKQYDNNLILSDLDPYTKDLFRTYCDELADKGDLNALRIKGYACYGGNAIYDCDWQTSANCMERLWKEGGFGYAANTLGYIYYYGRLDNGKPDYEKAFYYYSIGNTYGVIESGYKLADMFMNGYFVKKNVDMAAALIEAAYTENKSRFENGEFGGCFADLALRMGKLVLMPESGVNEQVGKIYALCYFLQAEFAVNLRIKQSGFWGDDKVKKDVTKQLEALSNQVPHRKRTMRLHYPTYLYSFMTSGPHSLYTIKLKSLKNDRIKITVTRVPKVPGRNSELTLMTYPEFGVCELTDTFTITAEGNAHYRKYSEEDVLIVDAIDERASDNGPVSHIFYLGGKTVLSISANGFIITNPHK